MNEPDPTNAAPLGTIAEDPKPTSTTLADETIAATDDE